MPLKGDCWDLDRRAVARMESTIRDVAAALGLAPSPAEFVLTVESLDEIVGRVRMLTEGRSGQGPAAGETDTNHFLCPRCLGRCEVDGFACPGCLGYGKLPPPRGVKRPVDTGHGTLSREEVEQAVRVVVQRRAIEQPSVLRDVQGDEQVAPSAAPPAWEARGDGPGRGTGGLEPDSQVARAIREAGERWQQTDSTPPLPSRCLLCGTGIPPEKVLYRVADGTLRCEGCFNGPKRERAAQEAARRGEVERPEDWNPGERRQRRTAEHAGWDAGRAVGEYTKGTE